jgi:hypothetical protein
MDAHATLALAVSFLCGLAIPAVVDLVTKSHLSNRVKAAIGAALSALAGALTMVTWAPNQRWQDYALAVAVAFVTTFSAHTTGYSTPNQRKTRKVGLG